MALCRLTDKHNGDGAVFINPSAALAVYELGGDTWVVTSAMAGNGASRTFLVEESAATVADLLNRAERDPHPQ